MKREFCDGNNYILKHSINGRDLVIHYADGSTRTEPYSIAREKELLEEEKKQIQSVVSNQSEYKKDWNKYKRRIIGFGATSLAYLTVFCLTFDFPVFLVTALFLYFTSRNVVNGREAYKKVKNIEKYKMFLKNEDRINQVVEDDRYKMSSRKRAGIGKVNANNIDRYKYSDITKILGESDCPRSEYGDTNTFSNMTGTYIDEAKQKIGKAKVKVKSLFR